MQRRYILLLPLIKNKIKRHLKYQTVLKKYSTDTFISSWAFQLILINADALFKKKTLPTEELPSFHLLWCILWYEISNARIIKTSIVSQMDSFIFICIYKYILYVLVYNFRLIMRQTNYILCRNQILYVLGDTRHWSLRTQWHASLIITYSVTRVTDHYVLSDKRHWSFFAEEAFKNYWSCYTHFGADCVKMLLLTVFTIFFLKKKCKSSHQFFILFFERNTSWRTRKED